MCGMAALDSSLTAAAEPSDGSCGFRGSVSPAGSTWRACYALGPSRAALRSTRNTVAEWVIVSRAHRAQFDPAKRGVPPDSASPTSASTERFTAVSTRTTEANNKFELDVTKIRNEARKHMDAGAVTAGNTVDVQRLIGVLNEVIPPRSSAPCATASTRSPRPESTVLRSRPSSPNTLPRRWLTGCGPPSG